MLEDLHQLKKDLDMEGIVFAFSGPMSHEIVEGIGGTLRNKMNEDAIDKTLSSKIFSIFVEQVQNVINYSTEKNPQESDMSYGIVVVGKQDNKYFVMGGNRMNTESVEPMRKNLNHLKSLDKEELKQLYKKRRKEGSEVTSKGAGIGFIEMARKSSEPLEFRFDKLDDKNEFFTIKIIA